MALPPSWPGAIIMPFILSTILWISVCITLLKTYSQLCGNPQRILSGPRNKDIHRFFRKFLSSFSQF